MNHATSILAEIRRVRLLPRDPFWSREVYERMTRGERLHYLANRGLSVEAMTQHLVSIGMLPSDCDSIAFLAFLDSALLAARNGRVSGKGKRSASVEPSDTDAELVATLAEYQAKIQAAPETPKQKANRNNRQECPQCRIVIWHGGFNRRAVCLNCLGAELAAIIPESDVAAILERVTFVYAPIDGIVRERSKPIPPHIRRNATESIPF